MKNRKVAIIGGLEFFVAMALLVLCWEKGNAQECRIVRINEVPIGYKTKLELDPPTISIAPNNCIVWFNRGMTIKARISFQDGKKCQAMTKGPSGFALDTPRNCYVTEYIPLGGTSSLTFNEKGTYNYEVETVEGLKEKGAIIVKE